jgi:hypothetical protein
MKKHFQAFIIIALGILTNSPLTQASSCERVILQKVISNGNMHPKFKETTEVDICEDGKVQVTIRQGDKKTTNYTELDDQTILQKALKYADELSAGDSVVSTCVGGKSTRYYAGKRIFYRKDCSATTRDESKTATKAKKILDSIEVD